VPGPPGLRIAAGGRPLGAGRGLGSDAVLHGAADGGLHVARGRRLPTRRRRRAADPEGAGPSRRPQGRSVCGWFARRPVPLVGQRRTRKVFGAWRAQGGSVLVGRGGRSAASRRQNPSAAPYLSGIPGKENTPLRGGIMSACPQKRGPRA